MGSRLSTSRPPNSLPWRKPLANGKGRSFATTLFRNEPLPRPCAKMAQRERESRLAGREDLEDLGATMARNAENWRRARRLLSVRAYDEMLAGASLGPGRRQARAF